MFGRRFAYGYQGSGEEGWTPPWLRQEREWQGQHLPGGHHGHGPFGHRGPFGHGGFGPRFFGLGDIKFALLELLQERPMYGYEMMKALEEKSAGFYTPSPGSIYPTLQMLEDRGFVAERQKNEQEFEGPPWMRHRGFGRQHRFSPEMQALKSEAMEVVRLLTIAGRMSFQDPEHLAKLRSIIERARKDLTDMIFAAGSQQEQASSASSTTSTNQAEGPSVEQA